MSYCVKWLEEQGDVTILTFIRDHDIDSYSVKTKYWKLQNDMSEGASKIWSGVFGGMCAWFYKTYLYCIYLGMHVPMS